MSDCPFCGINDGKIPSYTIYQDQYTRAFLDTNPSVEGHALVMLNKHGETLLDYTPEELRQLWSTVQKVVKAIQGAFNTSMLSIGINHGEPAGVHHFHIHILPRYPSDGGGIMQTIVSSRVIDDLSLVQNKIRAHITQ